MGGGVTVCVGGGGFSPVVAWAGGGSLYNDNDDADVTP